MYSFQFTQVRDFGQYLNQNWGKTERFPLFIFCVPTAASISFYLLIGLDHGVIFSLHLKSLFVVSDACGYLRYCSLPVPDEKSTSLTH